MVLNGNDMALSGLIADMLKLGIRVFLEVLGHSLPLTISLHLRENQKAK